MKVKLDAGGMLTITAENGTELYALKLWQANLTASSSNPGVPISSIRVAPFVEPAPALPLPEVSE